MNVPAYGHFHSVALLAKQIGTVFYNVFDTGFQVYDIAQCGGHSFFFNNAQYVSHYIFGYFRRSSSITCLKSFIALFFYIFCHLYTHDLLLNNIFVVCFGFIL